ncbi:MAG: AI-2E family transporter [Candidatus Heteroscillospira sp.]
MNLSIRNCIRAVVSLFALYLLVHYWPALSHGFILLLGAGGSLILGALIAYVVNIPMSFYERVLFARRTGKGRGRPRRAASMLLAVLSVLATAFLVVRLIVPALYDCVMLLVREIPPYVKMLWDYLNANFDVNDIIQSTGLIPSLENIDIHELATKAVNLLINGLGGVMNALTALLTTTFSLLVSLLVSAIFSIYLLMGKERIALQIGRVMNAYLPAGVNHRVRYVLGVVNNCFRRFIVGQCTEAVILGALCMFGMWALKFPYSTMIGALIGFTALIPIAGAYIGAGVGAFMIFTVSPVKALLFLLFIVLLQQFEGNVIYPKVVGASIGLPGIWVLCAITLGGGLAGIPGMLAGVPLAASVYQLVGADVRRREALAAPPPPPPDTKK